jgi:hypothetical protein
MSRSGNVEEAKSVMISLVHVGEFIAKFSGPGPYRTTQPRRAIDIVIRQTDVTSTRSWYPCRALETGMYWPATPILDVVGRLLGQCWSLTGCFSTAGVLDILIFLDTDRHRQLFAGAANHGVPIDSRDPRVAHYVGAQRINCPRAIRLVEPT